MTETIADTRIVLIRHGQTESNLAGKVQGQTDTPLTGLGVYQAQRAGQRFQKGGINHLYSSDLGRAVATAEIISHYTGLSVQRDSRFKEIHFGVAEGSTWREMVETHPQVAQRWRDHQSDARYPEGESRAEAIERVQQGFRELHECHPGDSVGIVTHGGILAAVFAWALGIPDGIRPRCQIQNASVNVIRIGNGLPKILSWGDISHIDGNLPEYL